MKKYIVLTLFCSLIGINTPLQVQAMQGSEEEICLKQCAICLEKENPRLEALPCGHTFHAQCLDAYIKHAFGSNDNNFDQLKCPHFSSHHSSCEGVLTRAQIAIFTSSSADVGNAAILAFFDERAHKRANPTAIVVTPADAAELGAIAAGHLQICPGCNSRANRIDGCNHMICTSNEGGCGIHYCYPCGTRYNPAINGGKGWGARACACPHFPGFRPEPIPVADGRGGALPQANPMALINAARNGDLEVVQALLNAPGMVVNARDAFGWTALQFAARLGHAEVVQELMARGADVNARGPNERTALHFATQGGDVEVVQALIAVGIQVNLADGFGNTALHIAAGQGHVAVVQALIDAEADVNTADGEGRTALHFAARFGTSEVVQTLIDAGAHVNTQDNHDRTALHIAASRCHVAVVNALLQTPGIQVNTQEARGLTALHFAGGEGHLPVVQALLGAGADLNTPDADGNTALHFSAGLGHLPVVQALLGARDIQVNTADQKGKTALQLAAGQGYEALCQELLKAPGIEVNAASPNGMTALHYAASRGRLRIVQGLIHAGVDLNTPDANGNTALHFAKQNGHTEVVKVLE